MYLLDTNVVSESRRIAAGRGDPRVAAWLEAVAEDAAFISAMTVFELELGILQVEHDRQQAAVLRKWVEETVLANFADRILPMTGAIALRCAGLHVPDPFSERDGWIAATALEHNLTIVTRNTKDFVRSGASIINPWEAAR
ncbi:MAG: type II toxin-antitoxin system VapC family toxin [Erythrobacter sp.]